MDVKKPDREVWFFWALPKSDLLESRYAPFPVRAVDPVDGAQTFTDE